MKMKINKLFKYIKENILYKIFLKWIYWKTILFLLLFTYSSIDWPVIALWFWIIIFLFRWAIKEDINSIKSLSIFIWIWYYLLWTIISGDLLIFSNKNIITVLPIFLLIIPLIFHFYKDILKVFKYFLKFIINIFLFIKDLIFTFFSYIVIFTGNIFFYLLLICIYSIIFLLPLIFFGDLWPILEPNYIYWIDNKEAVSFLLKSTSIYLIIIIIYSIILFIFRKKINRTINNIINYLINIKEPNNKIELKSEIKKDNLFLQITKFIYNFLKLKIYNLLRYKKIYYFIWLYFTTFIVCKILLITFS